MSFQTSVQENGEWVTRTVHINNVPARPPLKIPNPVRPERPTFGVLSTTVIARPSIRLVIPVRLRSKRHNDIAFINRDFVQISELVNDHALARGRHRVPHLIPVLRLQDFGLNIRNAAVIGPSYASEAPGRRAEEDSGPSTSQAKLEDVTVDGSPTLPPQLLALALESGDLAICFVKSTTEGTPEFSVTLIQRVGGSRVQGHLLAVDALSRYLVTASPTGMLVVYELHSRLVLEEQFRTTGTIDPIKSRRAQSVQGVIHRLAFLHPDPLNESTVNLVLVVVVRERPTKRPVRRLLLFDWLLGEILKDALARQFFTCRFPDTYQLPLYIVPLRTGQSFVLICPSQILLVKNLLGGSPVYLNLDSTNGQPTSRYFGASKPSWIAWARPSRRESYYSRKLMDNIYVAREDGAVVYFDFSSANNDIASTLFPMARLDTNVDTAFAIADDRWSDVLIVGGELGATSLWEILPRVESRKISATPRWSSVTDVAVSGHEHAGASHPGPQSLYSTAVSPSLSTITEWRIGMQARVGLEIDTEEALASKFWTFIDFESTDRQIYALMALPRSSILIRFSANLEQAEGVDEDEMGFDTHSRTLCAAQAPDGSVTQVTETSITVGSLSNRSTFSIRDFVGTHGISVESAAIRGPELLLTTYLKGNSQVYTFLVQGTHVSLLDKWDINGEVTSMCLFQVQNRSFACVSSVSGREPSISVYSKESGLVVSRNFDRRPGIFQGSSSSPDGALVSAMDVLTSLVVFKETSSEVVLLSGSRDGRFVTIVVRPTGPTRISWFIENLGRGPLTVFPSEFMIDGSRTCLMSYDGRVVMLTGYLHHRNRFSNKHYVWATDSNNLAKPQPHVSWMSSLPISLSGEGSRLSVLFLAGSSVLVADLLPVVGHCPRSIPLNASPSRLLYSDVYGCLIVAMFSKGRPTLALIDPRSGKEISLLTDKANRRVEFLSGLGEKEDKIYGLHEWKYEKSGETFDFIVVTTKLGFVLIISVQRINQLSAGGEQPQWRMWTRHKKRFGAPGFCITTDGGNLFYCVDREICWDVLEEKELNKKGSMKLESPTTSIYAANGKLLALTTSHSLHVLDYRVDNADPPVWNLTLEFVAEAARQTTHMVVVRHNDKNQPSVVLLVDSLGGIASVWIPWGSRQKSLVQLSSGQLSAPIRRLVKIDCLPVWRRPRLKYMNSTWSQENVSQILGVSVGGALQHITILDIELWRFLRLVQNMAQNSSIVFPLVAASLGAKPASIDIHVSQEDMHINGDILARCLEVRALEQLVEEHDSSTLVKSCLQLVAASRDRVYLPVLRNRAAVDNAAPEMERLWFLLAYEILEDILQSPMT